MQRPAVFCPRLIDRSLASRATPVRRRQSALSGRDTPIRLFFMRAIGNPYKNRIFATLCLRPERHGKCKISARLMKPTRKQIWTIAYPILISLLMENMIGLTDTAFLAVSYTHLTLPTILRV